MFLYAKSIFQRRDIMSTIYQEYKKQRSSYRKLTSFRKDTNSSKNNKIIPTGKVNNNGLIEKGIFTFEEKKVRI
jgi:hypothetical protein